ncbi:MAG: ribosomal-protein-alanine N-acetyltransferase [Desulfuromonas sp.]|uniref:ribosomal protein S18-alanine N-acetyltransferase n=1 Tax=Desulfuromonas sp. TaxID=892 RepID=UPI000CC10131|nr:ribosomal protein S18-alanine N-acetyltransferase [Desulfuromonas sp.]PLX84707.1 MAG: ribosomal-protein-alanine N-acetyltransferase [Desulfuromonas sp.]
MPDCHTIRQMTPEDLEAVLALESTCYRQPWSRELFLRELENPHAEIDLLWIGNRLAGFLCSWMIGPELEIHNVATSPELRRGGVGSSLLRHVLSRGRSRGLERAFLEVRKGNLAAIALYRAFGFSTVAVRTGYYQDGEDALIMELHEADAPE